MSQETTETRTGPAFHQQSPLPVAFSGAPGAYSEEAAHRYFGAGQATLTCDSPAEAARAVQDGRALRAVVPVENSITGRFAGMTEVLFDSGLGVVGEVRLPVRHCLLGAPQAHLDDISVVTSHPSALAQCRDWLASWGVATRPASDTAAAARELADAREAALGVLGSRALAELYGLDVLAEGISDRKDNVTRFLVLARPDDTPEEVIDTDSWRTGLLVGPVETPRALKTLRIRLEAFDAWRARVPFLGSEDGTRFLVEFDHRPEEGAALAARACEGLPFRILGSWAPAR